jgi:hypothetical protein
VSGLDYLHQATYTYTFAITWLCLQCIVAACILSDFIRRRMVRGTRAHYVMTTIARTLGVPAILMKMTDLILDTADKDYLMLAIDVVVLMYLILYWFWTKDDDNWWKGRGRKIGRAVRGAFTSARPAAEPA